MAVRKQSAPSARRAWVITLSLIVLFGAALFLRAYWNIDAATQDGQFVLSGGSDPYYHKRAVDAIQSEGYQTLFHDPLLNYPHGAVNPNPPLYEWSIAAAGQLLAPLFDGDVETATWWAILWSPAVYGALTVFPVFFIARSLFDWRAGLVAALFWTVSTSAIDTGGLGDADHDSAIMFFATLAFLFYIKAIERFRGDGNWVTNWRDASQVGPGLARFFRQRRLGLTYSLLSAVAIGAVALVWKGFPYVIGIMFIYAGLQLVIDHWRSRDSLGVWTATFIAITLGTLIAYPYYAAANVANFVRPVWFIVGAFVVAGLVLVPTRDLPTILVMPAAALAAILGAIVAFFVFPDVAQGLLYATVYFKRTDIYETIAEAHPAAFSNLVFGIGPVPFFLAFFGWWTLLFAVRRHPTRAILFALTWGAVALVMATTAIRFLHNAIPAFAVFAAFMTIWLVDWLDFGTVRKALAANRGNAWQGLRKGTRPMQFVTIVLAILLLAIPNAMLAADAALPPEKEREIFDRTESDFVKGFVSQRFGAYGQGFIPGYWREGLNWLDEHDANVTPHSERGAFLSWWDYGHWVIAVGNHPAVADNFQNGYVFAANFLLAQNETHSVQLLTARLVPLMERDAAESALADAGASDPAAAYDQLLAHERVADLSLEQSAAFLRVVEEATGKRIRYFATDVRMLPFDDPETPSIEQTSIYYAPVRLAGAEGDTYVPIQINTGDRWVTQDQFQALASDPTRQVSGTAERLVYRQPFFDSMYWRGYVGPPVTASENPQQPTLGDRVAQALNSPAPAHGLVHWRLVYANDGIKLLEYTPGAIVRGTVTEAGEPLANVTLTAYDDAGRILIEGFTEQFRQQVKPDDFNVAHGTTTTDATGAYELVAPFALAGGVVTIVAERDGAEIARHHLAITREDAESRATFEDADIAVEPGRVEGLVFEDNDGDGAYDAANDTLSTNTTVTIAGKSATTDADGRYAIEDVSPGVHEVTVDSTTHRVGDRSRGVGVTPGETTTHNVSLVLLPGTLDGTAWADLDGDGEQGEDEGAAFADVRLAPDDTVEGNTATATTALADSAGAFTTQADAGTYLVTVAWTAPDGTAYEAQEQVVVASGETVQRTFQLVATG